MNVAVIGKGLIGGSLEKAALRAKHNAEIFRGRAQLPDLNRFDFVFLAVPPSAVEGKVREIAASGTLREGAVVMDISGVKGSVCQALADFENTKGWTFIGAHPMAGKEKLGYENSCENLFDGASMILTPFESTGKAIVESTSEFLKTLGFSRVVVTDPADHDEMIAYTSQLCHLISYRCRRAAEKSVLHNVYRANRLTALNVCFNYRLEYRFLSLAEFLVKHFTALSSPLPIKLKAKKALKNNFISF